MRVDTVDVTVLPWIAERRSWAPTDLKRAGEASPSQRGGRRQTCRAGAIRRRDTGRKATYAVAFLLATRRMTDMPAPKRPNTEAATAAVRRRGQETAAAKLREAGWTVIPPKEVKKQDTPE